MNSPAFASIFRRVAALAAFALVALLGLGASAAFGLTGTATTLPGTPAGATLATGSAAFTFTWTGGSQGAGSDPGEYFEITFPAGFDVSGVTGATLNGFGVGATATTSVSGQIVTVQRGNNGNSIAPGTAGLGITLTGGITNPTVVQTLTNAISIVGWANAGPGRQEQDSGYAATANIVCPTTPPCPLIANSYTPASLVAGASTNVAINFTLQQAMTNDGQLLFTFPTTFDLQGVTGASSAELTTGFAGNGVGAATIDNVAHTVLLELDQAGTAPAAGAKTVTLMGVANPGVSGASGTLGVAVKTAGGTAMDTGTASGVTLTPGALSSTSVTPATLLPQDTPNVTVAFTSANPIPADGKVRVTFPAGFDVSGAAFASATGIDGTATASVSGQTVTITRSNDGTASAAGAKTVVLSGIVNPATTGTTGTFALATELNDATLIDQGTAAAVTIATGALTSASVTPASLLPQTPTSTSVAFTTADPLPANGAVVVTFPAGFNVAGATFTSFSGITGTGTVSVSGQTVTVTRSGGSSSAAGAKTLVLGGIITPATTGATGTFSLATARSTGVQIDTGSAAAVTIATGSLSATSVTPASLVAGAVGDVTIALTTSNVVPADGAVTVMFPAGFVVGGVGPTASFGGTVPFDGAASVTALGQMVTITRTGGTSTAAGAKTITIHNVQNPGVSGATGTFALATTRSTGVQIDTGSASAVSITPGVLASPAVNPASLVAGANGSVVVSLTTVNPVAADGKITIDFPSGFDVSSVAATATYGGAVPFSGTNTVTTSGQLVTVTRTGGSTTLAGPKTITLGGIRNPQVPGATGTFALATKTAGNASLDTATASAVTITPGAITAGAVVPASTVAGATGNVAVSLTTANPLANNGKIRVVFPAGFDVSGVGASASYGGSVPFDGTNTVAASGQTVTITRTGGTTTAAGAKIVTLTGIKNPEVSGVTAAYTLSTTTAGAVTIDTGSANGTTITAGALTGVSLTPDNLMVSRYATDSIVFTTANPVPANGKVSITFGPEFDPNDFGTITAVSGMDGTLTGSVTGQTLTLTRGGGATTTAGGVTVTITVANIQNPAAVGLGPTSTITTRDSAGVAIDRGTAPGQTFLAGDLTAVTVTPASLDVNALGNVVVAFTTTDTVPANGKVAIDFPAGFNVSGVGSTAVFGGPTAFNGDNTVSVQGNEVTVARSGNGTDIGAGAKTITLTGIRNPGYAGLTQSFNVVTTEANDNVLDSGGAPGVTIVPGAITAASVNPNTTAAGTGGPITINLTTQNAVPNDGQIVVTFPAGFDLSSVLPTAQFGGAVPFTGSNTVSVSGQVVTITRSGDGTTTGPGAKTITLGNITNQQVTGTTGDFTIATKYVSDVTAYTIDSGSASGITITPGLLSSDLVTPANLTAGGTGDVVVAFSTLNPVPATGKVTIAFPAGFDVSNVGPVATFGGAMPFDGNGTVTVNGQVVTVTRSGGSTSVLGGKTVNLTGITSPVVSGTSPTFTITTRTAADVNIDQGTAAGVQVAAGAATQLLVILPGQTQAPGTATGRTGDPVMQVMGQVTTVNVVATDAHFNTSPSAAGPVTLTSTDGAATLPGAFPLSGGTATVNVTNGTNGVSVLIASATGLASGSSAPYAVSASADAMSLTSPSNTLVPLINGVSSSSKPGATASCYPGTWSNASGPYTYSWYRDGALISGATSTSYTLQAADTGLGLVCKVTASNAAGSTTAASASVAVPPLRPTLVSKTVWFSGPSSTVTLRYPAAGAASAQVIRSERSGKKIIGYIRARRVPSGSVKMTVILNSRGIAMLSSARSLTTQLFVSYDPTVGGAGQTALNLTIKAARSF